METELIKQILGLLDSGGDAGSVVLAVAVVLGFRELRKMVQNIEGIKTHMEDHADSAEKLLDKAGETVERIDNLNATQVTTNAKLDQIGRDVLTHGPGD